MKKTILLTTLLLNVLSGCSSSGCYYSSGLQKFSTNDYYYVNWCQYEYCIDKGTYAECYNSEDELVTNLHPLSNEEVAAYRERMAQEEAYRRARMEQEATTLQMYNNYLNNTLQQQNQNLQQLNQNLQYQTQQTREYTDRLRQLNQNFQLHQNLQQNQRTTRHTNCYDMGNFLHCTSY